MSSPISDLFRFMEKAKRCRDNIEYLKDTSLLTEHERDARLLVYKTQMLDALGKTHDHIGPAMSQADPRETRIIKSAYTNLLRSIEVECVA